MSKITVRQWKAPIEDQDRDRADELAKDGPLKEGRNIELVETTPPLMSGTEANHPLVVDPDDAGKPIVLKPQPTPMASNYFYKNIVTWRAEYESGHIRHQVSEFGKELSSDHLPRKGLRRLVLVDTRSGDDIIAHDFEVGDMAFYRRRTAMRPGDDVVEVVHILGKTRSKEGPNEIFFVFESDQHIEEGDFETNPRSRWRYPLNWHDEDLIAIT